MEKRENKGTQSVTAGRSSSARIPQGSQAACGQPRCKAEASPAQAKVLLKAHIKPVRDRLTALLEELNVPLELMERAADDNALSKDKEYQALVCLYCDIENGLERYNRILTGKNK